MKFGKIELCDAHGNIVSRGRVGFWNASNDETDPDSIAISISGKELQKFFSTEMPKVNPLLQIVLSIDDVREVIGN